MPEAKQNQIGSNEYEAKSVPRDKRRSLYSLIVVFLGLVFVVTSMQVGGTIGQGLPFWQGIGATLLSSLILTVLGSFMGAIAAKTGLTFGLLSRFSFGQAGTWVPCVIVALTTVGWFSIDAYLIGQTTNALFPSAPLLLIAILAGVGMTITALFGMKWMTRLSDLAVPLIFIFSVISMVIGVKSVGGLEGLTAIKPIAPISFSHAVSLGVGSFAVGAIMFTPDFLRFAKNTKHAVIIMIVSILFGNSFVVLFGVIGALTTGSPDIAFVMAAQNLLAPAFLVLVLNIWSTAQGCVYSGSLSLSNSLRVGRGKVVIAFGVVGIIFAVIGFYNLFGRYIDILASTVPALAGIFIADYVGVYKGHYPDIEHATLPAINWSGFLAWGLGVATYYLIPMGFPVVNAVIISFIAKLILAKLIVSDKAASQE